MDNSYHQIPIPVIDAIYYKKLSGLSPIELAACVGSMANVKENNNSKYDKLEEARFLENENPKLARFVEYFDYALEEYNQDMKRRFPGYKNVSQSPDTVKRLYKWAYMNEKNPNSIENWKKLYSAEAQNDENLIKEEVSQAVDLLTQMLNIMDAGAKTSLNSRDKVYYIQMKSTISRSINLLAKEPIVSDAVS